MTQECPFTSRPTWSPDGSKLAFVCLSADQARTGLWVVNQDGSKVKELVDSGLPAQGPTWGDDGRIYYVAAEFEGDPSKIWSVSQNGGEPTPLTDTEDGWDSHVDWSEGGVFFLRSSSENAPGDTMFVTPDGFSKAFSDSGNVESPAYSPDGTAASGSKIRPTTRSSARCGSCATAKTSRLNSSPATSARPRGVVAELRIRPGWPPGYECLDQCGLLGLRRSELDALAVDGHPHGALPTPQPAPDHSEHPDQNFDGGSHGHGQRTQGRDVEAPGAGWSRARRDTRDRLDIVDIEELATQCQGHPVHLVGIDRRRPLFV